MISGFVGLGVLAVVFLLDESAFDRWNHANNPVRPEGWLEDRVKLLVGVTGHRAWRRRSVAQGCVHIWNVFRRPQFFFMCKLAVL